MNDEPDLNSLYLEAIFNQSADGLMICDTRGRNRKKSKQTGHDI